MVPVRRVLPGERLGERPDFEAKKEHVHRPGGAAAGDP
jgi:hypothetical protein